MSDELKPCPFCGIVPNSDGYGHHADDCYLMVHFYKAPLVERDRRAWGIRPVEDDLRRQLEEAQQRAAKYQAALEEIAA